MVVGIESMDRASSPSSECSPFAQIQNSQCATKRSKCVRATWCCQIHVVSPFFRLLMAHHKSEPEIDVKIESSANSLHHSGFELLMAHCFFARRFVPGAESDSVG